MSCSWRSELDTESRVDWMQHFLEIKILKFSLNTNLSDLPFQPLEPVPKKVSQGCFIFVMHGRWGFIVTQTCSAVHEREA